MRSIGACSLFALLVACGGSAQEELCEQVFEPYPDMITGRSRTTLNSTYLDGMALYSAGDYAGARDSIERFLRTQRADLTGYMYLASAYLALGDPYKAELQLDHLGRGNNLHFDDQISWYTVVCWVCSGQIERARTGAARIAEGRSHTYRADAKRLLNLLPKAPATE
jgi:predicted Zn-dependent protease